MSVVRPFDDVELAEALAAQPGWSRHVAEAALDRARRIDADPLDVLAAMDGADREGPYRRAAAFLGVQYRSDITRFLMPLNGDFDVDRFAGLRSIRGQIEGKETLFLSPGFAHLRGLAARVGEDGGLRARLCIVSIPSRWQPTPCNGWRADFRSQALISTFRWGRGLALSWP